MLAGSLINFSIETLYQMLIQGAIFIMFFLAVKKFFFDKVMDMVNQRENMITDEIKHAEEDRDAAATLKEAYEEKVSSINEEVYNITNSAIKEANEIKANILSEADDEAREIKNKSMRDIELAKEAAVKEMKDNIIDISFDITNTVLDAKLDKETEEDLVKKAIERLDEASYE